jgi:hypothetical protein
VVTPDKFLVLPKMNPSLIKKLPSRRRWKLRKPNGLPKKPPPPAVTEPQLMSNPPMKPERPDGPPTKPKLRP